MVGNNNLQSPDCNCMAYAMATEHIFPCFSSIWGLGEFCRETQSNYQKRGIQGRWQVTPDDLEPPQKKMKALDTDLTDVIQMKVSDYCVHILLICFQF